MLTMLTRPFGAISGHRKMNLLNHPAATDGMVLRLGDAGDEGPDQNDLRFAGMAFFSTMATPSQVIPVLSGTFVAQSQ